MLKLNPTLQASLSIAIILLLLLFTPVQIYAQEETVEADPPSAEETSTPTESPPTDPPPTETPLPAPTSEPTEPQPTSTDTPTPKDEPFIQAVLPGCTNITPGNPPLQASFDGNADCFTFDGTTGDEIRIVVTSATSAFNPDLELLRPNDTTLCSTIFSQLTCQLDTTGTYSIVVDGLGSDTYYIHLQRLNNPATCVNLPFGNPPNQQSYTIGEQDCFIFNGIAGDEMRVVVTSATSAFNPDLEIIRPNGLPLCDTIFSQLTCQFDITGQHMVIVDGLGSGTYYIHLQRLNNPATCVNLPFGNPASQQNYTIGEQDCFIFNGTTGDEMRVVVTPANAFNPDLEMIRPNGLPLCDTIFSQLTCQLDITGQHMVIVDGLGTGNYSIHLSCTTCPVQEPIRGIPLLTAPPRNSFLNNPLPNFTWNGVTNATQYQIQIDNECNFRTPEEDSIVNGTNFIPANALSDSRYCWRARGLNTGYTGRWSRVGRLTIDTVAPTAPLLRLPAAGALIGTTRPRLVWQAVRDARMYHVQVDNEPSFANPLITDQITGRRAALPLSTPQQQGTYYWRVAAIDAASNEGAFSSAQSFDISLMASPRDNQIIRSRRPYRANFVWRRAIGGVGYRLEVATDPGFGGAIIYTAETTRTSHRLPLGEELGPGTYYWRIQLDLGSGMVEPPFYHTFTIETP